MKKIHYLFAFFLTLTILASCSSSEEVLEQQNQLITNGKQYPIKSLFIEEFVKGGEPVVALNMLNITEQDLRAVETSNAVINNLNIFNILIRTESLEPKTYNTDKLYYEFMVDGKFAGDYDDEQLLMEYENGDQVKVILHSINETDISLEFEVKKANGNVAVGTYKGKISNF